MPAIIRGKIDTHIGHACDGTGRGHPKPFHKTPYVSSQTDVNVQGGWAIVDGDSTSCGDPVKGFSSKVTIGGKGVHRTGDATGGHDCHFVPNAAAAGASKVTAGD